MNSIVQARREAQLRLAAHQQYERQLTGVLFVILATLAGVVIGVMLP